MAKDHVRPQARDFDPPLTKRAYENKASLSVCAARTVVYNIGMAARFGRIVYSEQASAGLQTGEFVRIEQVGGSCYVFCVVNVCRYQDLSTSDQRDWYNL